MIDPLQVGWLRSLLVPGTPYVHIRLGIHVGNLSIRFRGCENPVEGTEFQRVHAGDATCIAEPET